MTLGRRLQELRIQQNLTQSELAEKTGLSSHAINSYENNRREPNSKAMAALERFFGVSGAYLRGEAEAEYKWDDKELMESISAGFPEQLAVLAQALAASSGMEQKMVFDILVELRHVLASKSMTTQQKQGTLYLMQSVVSMVSMGDPDEAPAIEDMIKKYRQLDGRGQAAVLDTLKREYEYMRAPVEVPVAAYGGGKQKVITTQAKEDQLKERLAKTKPPEDL